MHRSHARRVALTSSLALLVGAGFPVEQVAAEVAGPRPASGKQTVDGFELVPGRSPAAAARTPETPGASGFQLLPKAAAGEGGEANARAPAAAAASAAASADAVRSAGPAPLKDVDGFQMEPAPALQVSASPMALKADEPVTFADAPAQARLASAVPASSLVTAGPIEQVDGFVLLAPSQLHLQPQANAELTAPQAARVSGVVPSATVEAEEAGSFVLLTPAAALQLKQQARAELAAPKMERLAAALPAARLESAEEVPFVLVTPPAAVALRPERRIELSAISPGHVAGAAPALTLEAAAEDPAIALASHAPLQLRPQARAELSAPQLAGLSAERPDASVAPLGPELALAPARQLDLRHAEAVALNAPAAARVADAVPGFELLPEAPSVQLARADLAFRPAEPAVTLTSATAASTSADARLPSLTLASADDRSAGGFVMLPATVGFGAAEAAAVVVGGADTSGAPSADVVAPAAPAPRAADAPIQLAQADAQPGGLTVPAPKLTPIAPEVAAPAPLPPEAAAPPPAAPPPAPAPGAPPAAGQPAPAPAAPAAPPEQQSAVVGRIIVQGNERIEASTILSYLPIQPGDTVDAAKLDLGTKTLFRTDLFSDVSMEMQGSDLIVKVSENPIINQVVFEGNHSVKEDKLRDEVTIRPRGIFTRSRVEQDVQRIIELYRRSGRISATVTPKIVQLPQKRVDLIFEIDEGPKSGILHINFIGNKSFGDGALSDVIVTRESHWYKFFQSNDNYDPDRLEYDREQLRKFYRNHGFYDFRIISAVAELAPDRNGFVVTFTIDEGPRYHFGKLKVETQLKRLNSELLTALLPIKEGQLYEDDRIEKATDALTYAAGANGFAFVDVRPRYTAHPETKTVDVTFDIREGPRVYIERIDIVGNTQTLDRVIRRELRVSEGDAYNRVLVDRSKNQIRALGFFKDVDIEQLPGSAPDKTILRVKVTEQPTGQLTFSLGYSSLEKLVGDVGISQSNFRGRGQQVNFDVSLGYLRKQVTLSFTEPRFMGRNMSAGFDLYYYRYNFSTQASFETSSVGTALKVGFPINQYASLQLRYSIHSDTVDLPSYVLDPATRQCAPGYSQSLCDEVGTTWTSSVGYTLRWDRRNDPILPTRGFYIDVNQDFAGLGGVRYIKSVVDGAWYYGFTPSWILSFQAQAGYIKGWGGDLVRINDRFFRGGDTFRGFDIAGVGPRDISATAQGTSGSSNTTIGNALGGNLVGIGTVELAFPTPIPQQYGIKTALFSDFGTVGLLDSQVKRNPDGTINTNIKDDLGLRVAVGINIKWKSPMGPLQFDLSKVIKKDPYDVTNTFWFSTATQF